MDIDQHKQKTPAYLGAVNNIKGKIWVKPEDIRVVHIKEEPIIDRQLISMKFEDLDGVGHSSCNDAASEISFKDTKSDTALLQPKKNCWGPNNEHECFNESSSRDFGYPKPKSSIDFTIRSDTDNSYCRNRFEEVYIKEEPMNDISVNSTDHEHFGDIANNLFNGVNSKTIQEGTNPNSSNLKMNEDAICEKPYQCDICNMFFTRSGHLKSHKLIHTGEKPYQCDVCKKSFRGSSYLKSHKLIHTGEKPYKCDICQRCFRKLNNLKSHQLKHPNGKPYRCDVCEQCFREFSSLKSHKLLHTEVKLHQCDVCNSSFQKISNLKAHKLIHTGEKPYECDVCKQRFRQSQSLKVHKLTHTGEKSHKCDVCKVYFRNPSRLKMHKLTHTGEKPYQCDICNNCFRQVSALKRHKLIHTGEKPYQCDVCKMCFRVSTHLKKHTLRHNQEIVPVLNTEHVE